MVRAIDGTAVGLGLYVGLLEGRVLFVGVAVGFLDFRLGAVVGVIDGRVFP